jgi:hypothetical protein
MPQDMDVYLKCMDKIRQRLRVVSAISAGTLTTGEDVLNTELMCVQFRKVLELIAFASLTANRDKYAEAHAKYGLHWRAKDMLKALEKVNPDYYPVPLDEPVVQPDGTKHFPRPADGFLTRDEFAVLYDAASDALHMRNPFSTKAPAIPTAYSIKDWVFRIQRLLRLHLMHLVDGDKWVVQIPSSGAIHLFPATPAASPNTGV